MRFLRIFLPVLIAFSIPQSAVALDAAARAECVGGSHVVSVSGQYIEEVGGEVYDGEISGLVFECQAIGVCEPGFFYPETPLAFEPLPNSEGWPIYEAEMTIVPPHEGVAYRYVPYGVRPDGSLVSTYHACGADTRSYALAACDGVPIVRGTVVIDRTYGEEIYFRIDSCEPNCWSEGVWVYDLNTTSIESLSGLPWGGLVGQTVDVFGVRNYCSMAGGDSHEITGITLAPDGLCGSVSVDQASWGSLKAMYR